MKKLYGSLDNRFDENKNFTGRELKVGDDITMYYWSDRTCYYIVDVKDQKHITVKKYEVCADHSKPGGMGHQDWLYFKTKKEKYEYLNSMHIKDLEGKDMQTDLSTLIEDEPEEWEFRYGKWNSVRTYTQDTWNKSLELAKADCKPEATQDKIEGLARYYLGLDDNNFAKLMSGKTIKRYFRLQPISFGVKQYYYDWEF